MDEQNVRLQLSERVKQALSEMDGTQEQIADAMGVSKRIISYWVSGERTPGLDKLELLAELSHRPLSWFFESDTGLSGAGMLARIQESADALQDRIDQFEFEAVWYRAFALSALREMSVVKLARVVKGHSFKEAWTSVKRGRASEYLEHHVTSRLANELSESDFDESTKAKALSLLSEVINPWLYAKAEAEGFLAKNSELQK